MGAWSVVLPMPIGGCRPNCRLYGIHLVWGTIQYDRYASKMVRVWDRVRDRVSVYSLPDDGVQSPILNDNDYVYMQGNDTTPPWSIDTEGIRYYL